MGSAEYLFSKSYWKPLIHSLRNLRRNEFKTFLVALALGSSIIYSFLVGPASAAALLPNRPGPLYSMGDSEFRTG